MQKIVQYTTQNDGYKKNGTLHVKGIMLHKHGDAGHPGEGVRATGFDKPGLGNVRAWVYRRRLLRPVPAV